MGAGRYNSQSKNHNGEHTGIGKKQKMGLYSMNGVHYKTLSHRDYLLGDKVYHKKTGELGIVIINDKKVPRSMIHILFDNKKGYYYTNMLYKESYVKDYIRSINSNNKKLKKKYKTNTNKQKLFIEKKQREEKEYIQKQTEKKKSNQLFKKYKKDMNKLIDESLEIHYEIESNNNHISKLVVHDNNNEFILNYTHKLKDKYKSVYKNLTDNMSSIDKYIPKYKLLELIKLTNCGSISNLTTSTNKEDHYQKVVEYMKICKK